MNAKNVSISPQHPNWLQRTKPRLLVPLSVGLLMLALGCADTHERSTGQVIDDQAISSRVQNALSSDPAFKYPDVKVTTFQGKVQLSGFVDQSEQKERAEDIAKKIKGVKDVRNSIVLK